MATKKKNSDQSEKSKNAYFLSLELENIRCFAERQKIDFSDGSSPSQWTIILGDNGTGKTTILQSLIATSPSPEFSSLAFEENEPEKNYTSPNAGSFFHITQKWKPFKVGSLKHCSLNANLITQNSFNLQRDFDNFFSLGISNNFGEYKNISLTNYWSNTKVSNVLAKITLFGYGASRKSGETSISEQNEESAYITLFDETTLLLNPEEWLIRTHYESLLESEFQEKRKQKLRKVIETLIQILPDITEFRFSEKKQNNKSQPIVEFQTPYGWVEAKDLSLGYRTSMAWMVDFASRMFDLYPDSENPLAEPAVVLIDEIDLHLHPKWQRDLLDWLSNLFPNTQFIVTTHSPLIVQSAAARDANFAVCRREGDHVVIDQSLEAVKNWRTDQILTSDLFGLESSRPKEIEKDLFERQQILAKAKLTKKDEKRLKEIEEKVGAVPMMENPLYDKMMDVIFRASEKLEKENSNGK